MIVNFDYVLGLRISTKLKLAFVVLILLSVVMAGIAIRGNYTLAEEWRELEQVTLAKQSAVVTGIVGLGNGVHHFKNYVLRGGDYDKKFGADMDQVDRVVKLYESTGKVSAEEAQILDSLRQ